jgi:hypothetical protein
LHFDQPLVHTLTEILNCAGEVMPAGTMPHHVNAGAGAIDMHKDNPVAYFLTHMHV